LSHEDKVSKLHPGYMQQHHAYVQRQKRRKQRLMRRLVLVSIITLLAVGTMITYHLKQRDLQAEKKQQYEEMEDTLTSLKKQEENLTEEINLLQDDEYVLEIARTNYFFSKKGELIFKIPDEEPSY